MSHARHNLVERRVNKYGAIRTHVDGHLFDSKAEAKRYQDLKNLQRAGHIEALELQPKFPLLIKGAKVGEYRGDFRYLDKATGEVVVEDVKGVRTPLYKFKRKIVEVLYGIVVREVS